jgi:hypothetical protein
MTITANTQVEFGGLLLEDGFEIVSVEGLADSPEVRSTDLARVARHGFLPGQDYLGGRSVTLTVDIYGWDDTSFAALVGAFRAVFTPGGPEEPLSFRLAGLADGGVVSINARPRRLSLPLTSAYWSNAVRATVQLYATDPLIYSALTTTTTIALPQPPGGFTFDLTFDFDFGAQGGPTTVTIVNSGTATAYPTVRVNGPVTDPSLRNETLDREVSVGLVVDTGEWLDIDFKNRTVLLNGSANRYQYLTVADWWGLEPGSNSIRYSAQEWSASSAVFAHKSAWL